MASRHGTALEGRRGWSRKSIEQLMGPINWMGCCLHSGWHNAVFVGPLLTYGHRSGGGGIHGEAGYAPPCQGPQTRERDIFADEHLAILLFATGAPGG
jgi:hypothetical protein